MPTNTTNYAFQRPLVNDPTDKDLWGDQLNSNWASLDTLLTQLIPIGIVLPYGGTTAPNSKWLLADGSVISRTTYAELFTLYGEQFGAGDGSTTFQLPDLRGRAISVLDNLGGSSANRVTDANADSLNNTGAGSETPETALSMNSITLSVSNLPSHTHNIRSSSSNANGAGSVLGAGSGSGANLFGSASPSITRNSTTSAGSGSSFTPTGTVNASAGDNLPPQIFLGAIIKALY